MPTPRKRSHTPTSRAKLEAQVRRHRSSLQAAARRRAAARQTGTSMTRAQAARKVNRAVSKSKTRKSY